MAYYLIYEVLTNRLISEGSVRPEQLPEGLAVLEYETRPDWNVWMWDQNTATLVDRPPPTRNYCSQVEFTKRIGLTIMTAVNMIRMDPNTPLQLRAQLETLRQVMQDASRIELTDPDTMAGVGLVATLAANAGLIENTPEAIQAEVSRILTPFPA